MRRNALYHGFDTLRYSTTDVRRSTTGLAARAIPVVECFRGRRPRKCIETTTPEVHPEDCTVHVRMDNGMEVPSVKVASAQWVTIDKDKNALSGERHLPPVNTYVFCMMPTGELSSAFVLCSGFATAEAEHSAFMKSGADAAATWERIGNSGWQSITDYRTGTTTIANKAQDAAITFTADQETVGEEVTFLETHIDILFPLSAPLACLVRRAI